jgi:hypothetical protein
VHVSVACVSVVYVRGGGLSSVCEWGVWCGVCVQDV